MTEKKKSTRIINSECLNILAHVSNAFFPPFNRREHHVHGEERRAH